MRGAHRLVFVLRVGGNLISGILNKGSKREKYLQQSGRLRVRAIPLAEDFNSHRMAEKEPIGNPR